VSIGGIVSVHHNLVFLNNIRRRCIRCSANIRSIVADTVHVRLAGLGRAVHDLIAGHVIEWARILRARKVVRTRAEVKQTERIAGVERQLLDALVVDDLTDVGFGCLNLLGARIHGDNLARRTHAELKIDRGSLVGAESNVRLLLSRKTFLGYRDVVRSRNQVRNRIVAAICGNGLNVDSRRLIVDYHLGAWNNCPGGIENMSCELLRRLRPADDSCCD